MLSITAKNVIHNFDQACNKVIQTNGPILITRDNDKNVVLISQVEYNNLLENIYIRKSMSNYSMLLESIEQAKTENLTVLDIDR